MTWRVTRSAAQRAVSLQIRVSKIPGGKPVIIYANREGYVLQIAEQERRCGEDATKLLDLAKDIMLADYRLDLAGGCF